MKLFYSKERLENQWNDKVLINCKKLLSTQEFDVAKVGLQEFDVLKEIKP